jgi:hypothetical protein
MNINLNSKIILIISLVILACAIVISCTQETPKPVEKPKEPQAVVVQPSETTPKVPEIKPSGMPSVELGMGVDQVKAAFTSAISGQFTEATDNDKLLVITFKPEDGSAQSKDIAYFSDGKLINFVHLRESSDKTNFEHIAQILIEKFKGHIDFSDAKSWDMEKQQTVMRQMPQFCLDSVYLQSTFFRTSLSDDVQDRHLAWDDDKKYVMTASYGSAEGVFGYMISLTDITKFDPSYNKFSEIMYKAESPVETSSTQEPGESPAENPDPQQSDK